MLSRLGEQVRSIGGADHIHQSSETGSTKKPPALFSSGRIRIGESLRAIVRRSIPESMGMPDGLRKTALVAASSGVLLVTGAPIVAADTIGHQCETAPGYEVTFADSAVKELMESGQITHSGLDALFAVASSKDQATGERRASGPKAAVDLFCAIFDADHPEVTVSKDVVLHLAKLAGHSIGNSAEIRGRLAKLGDAAPELVAAYDQAAGLKVAEEIRTAEVSAQAIQLVQQRLADIALKTTMQLSGEGTNPVITGVITASHFGQLLPSLDNETQSTILANLGLSSLSPSEASLALLQVSQALVADLPAGVELSTSDGVYLPKAGEVGPELAAIYARMGLTLTEVDFPSGDAERAINADVRAATDGKIESLVRPGSLANASFYMAGAVNLDAAWQRPFDGTQTKAGAFRLDDGSSISARMMKLPKDQHRVATGDGYQALSLPVGGDFHAVYIKPTNGQSIEDFTANLDGERLRKILREAEAGSADGTVSIPRSTSEFKPSDNAMIGIYRDFGLPEVASLFKDGGTVRFDRAAYAAIANADESGLSMAAAQGIGGSRGISIGGGQEQVAFQGDRSMLQVFAKGDEVVFLQLMRNPQDG